MSTPTPESQGFIRPSGDDYIREGDDAISKNALRAVELIWQYKSFERTLTVSDNMDTLLPTVPKEYNVLSGTTAAAVGLPIALASAVRVIPIGTATIQIQYVSPQTDGTAPVMQRERYPSGLWTAWHRTDHHNDSPPEGLTPATPNGLKSVGIPCTLGYGGSQTTGQGFARLLQRMPATATRYRLRFRNWNPRYGMDDNAAVALSNMSVGVRSGSTSTSWNTVASSGNTGTDGYVTPWNTVAPSMLGQDVLVAYGWESSGTVQQNIGTAYTGTTAATALTGSATKAGVAPLFVVLEVEVPASQPVAAVFGDSIASGVGSTNPVYDSWLDQWGRANGVVITHWSHSGDYAATWEDPESKKWTLYGTDIAPADVVFYALGSNDLFASTTPAPIDIQTDIRTLVPLLRRHVSPNVVATTILPRTNVTGAGETVRRTINTWLRLSGLFRDVFDMAAAVSTNDETLNPAFDADGVHLNTAGYAAMAAAITRPVVSNRQQYTIDQTAGRTVKVWDYLNNRDQIVYGSTGIRDISSVAGNLQSGSIEISRENNRVFYKLYNVVPTDSSLPITLGTAFARGNGFYNAEKVWHRLAPYGAPIVTHKQMATAGSDILIGAPVAAGGVSCSFSHPTADPWPTSLPGAAA